LEGKHELSRPEKISNHEKWWERQGTRRSCGGRIPVTQGDGIRLGGWEVAGNRGTKRAKNQNRVKSRRRTTVKPQSGVRRWT